MMLFSGFLTYDLSSSLSLSSQTFIMCKPDAVQRGIVGEIIKRFEAKGFKLVAMKMMWVSSSADNWITSRSNVDITLICDFHLHNNTG